MAGGRHSRLLVANAALHPQGVPIKELRESRVKKASNSSLVAAAASSLSFAVDLPPKMDCCCCGCFGTVGAGRLANKPDCRLAPPRRRRGIVVIYRCCCWSVDCDCSGWGRAVGVGVEEDDAAAGETVHRRAQQHRNKIIETSRDTRLGPDEARLAVRRKDVVKVLVFMVGCVVSAGRFGEVVLVALNAPREDDLTNSTFSFTS